MSYGEVIHLRKSMSSGLGILLGIFPLPSNLPLLGKSGNYAIVLSTNTYWYWNNAWIDSGILTTGVTNPDGSSISEAIGNEQLWILRRMAKIMESLSTVDIANRQKVVIEGLVSTTLGVIVGGLSSGAGFPAPNQPVNTYAPTPAAGGTYWQPVRPGPVDPRYTNMEQAKINYNTGIRSHLSFT